jgi:hypothetical protein
MPTHPSDPHTKERKRARGRAVPVGPPDAAERLDAWLSARAHVLASEWWDELRVRGQEHTPVVDAVVARFLAELASFLPLLLGPRGEAVQPLWERACELFGTMAAKRGLAAGEVIEEFQVLRELLIRDLYEAPPRGGPTLREALRLNRALDRGVTYASVGHTDAMFFALLEGQGGGDLTRPDEAAAEAVAQLRTIREELDAAMGSRVRDAPPAPER